MGHSAGQLARPAKLALMIGLLGAWSVAVPYVGNALGLDVNVPADLEVIDHVIPGLIVALAAGVAYRSLRRGTAAASLAYLIAVGVSLLAGLWITATHIPLLLQAARGTVGWPQALWHSLPGFPLPVLAIALYALSPTEAAPRAASDAG